VAFFLSSVPLANPGSIEDIKQVESMIFTIDLIKLALDMVTV
jgi:hypothetical protein